MFISITIQEVNTCVCNICELCSASLNSRAVLMNNYTEKQICFHVYCIQNLCQRVSVHTWLWWVHYHSSDKVSLLGRFKFVPIFTLTRVFHSKIRQSITTWTWQNFFWYPMQMPMKLDCVCTQTHVRTYVRVCTYTYVCMNLCKYASVCVYI